MGVRIEGRKPDEMRPVTITRDFVRYAEGSALIVVGETKVLCTASVEDRVPPFLRDTGQGWVTAEYSMLPRSTRVRTPREMAARGRAYEIQRLIGRALRAVTDLSSFRERTIVLDCDVIQADGGTRTAAITGAFVALADAVRRLRMEGIAPRARLKDFVAAISVGYVEGGLLLDLNYAEDSIAEVDMNVAMTGGGRFVEVQGTAEEVPFDQEQLTQMLSLAAEGIRRLVALQRELLGEAILRENAA